MKRKYNYVGCFFDPEELYEKVEDLRDKKLEKEVKYPHVTFEYKPEYVDTSLFGEVIEVEIIGYGNNSENEGVSVELHSENAKLSEMISTIAVPHITLSTSAYGKAVDTRNLEFRPLPEPILLMGTFGAYGYNGKVCTSRQVPKDVQN